MWHMHILEHDDFSDFISSQYLFSEFKILTFVQDLPLDTVQ